MVLHSAAVAIRRVKLETTPVATQPARLQRASEAEPSASQLTSDSLRRPCEFTRGAGTHLKKPSSLRHCRSMEVQALGKGAKKTQTADVRRRSLTASLGHDNVLLPCKALTFPWAKHDARWTKRDSAWPGERSAPAVPPRLAEEGPGKNRQSLQCQGEARQRDSQSQTRQPAVPAWLAACSQETVSLWQLFKGLAGHGEAHAWTSDLGAFGVWLVEVHLTTG